MADIVNVGMNGGDDYILTRCGVLVILGIVASPAVSARSILRLRPLSDTPRPSDGRCSDIFKGWSFPMDVIGTSTLLTPHDERCEPSAERTESVFAVVSPQSFVVIRQYGYGLCRRRTGGYDFCRHHTAAGGDCIRHHDDCYAAVQKSAGQAGQGIGGLREKILPAPGLYAPLAAKE